MKVVYPFLPLICFGITGWAQQPDSSRFYINARGLYLDAFDELEEMLYDESRFAFKRGVFITENAYMDGTLDYETFLRRIDSHVKLVNAIAVTDGLKYSKRDRRQVLLSASIFRSLKDSITLQLNNGERVEISPYQYDHEDFWGEADWTKMFVSKLLYTRSGNCHSLPALYKILADEIGVSAWLALAPNHTYIKQWNDEMGWYNTELTTGRFPIDSEIKWQSYIKSEAIASGVYMDTLSKKENIAYLITDLAQGYVRKYNYDDVDAALQWLEVAIKNYPDYPNALILKAELQKKKYELRMAESRVDDFKALWTNQKDRLAFSELQDSYVAVHNIGYRRMPKEMYLNWLYKVKGDTSRKPFKFDAPEPFKKYNYQVQYVMAGDGRNDEFYDEQDIVRIGSVELNRLTGKILRFIQPEPAEMPDASIGRMYDPALGRWWQMDPEAEGYNNVSPYNYANNDPINNIDPDGQDWYRYSDKDGNEAVIWQKGSAKNVEIDGQTYNNIGAVFASQAADGSVVIYNQNEVFAVVDADSPAGDAQENAAIGAMQNPEAEHHFNTMTPGMETLFFAAETSMTISGGAAYSSGAKNGRSSNQQGKERQVQTKLEDLNSSQQANLRRFIKKVPKNSQQYQIRKLGNGNIQITAESPGQVPGSKALYVKEIDNTGTTVKMYKVTTDPAGNFVHLKNKLSEY